jgi:glycosyltransferase involved in cell wall biosynthesis
MKVLMLASWNSQFFIREAKLMNRVTGVSVDLVLINSVAKLKLLKSIKMLLFGVNYKKFNDEGLNILTLDYLATNLDCNKLTTYVCKFLNRSYFKLLKRKNFDIVHLQSLKPAALLWYDWQFKLVTSKLIFTEHNQFNFYGLTFSDQKKIRKLIKLSNKKLAVSKDKLRQFAINGIHLEMDVIGNCIDNTFTTDLDKLNEDRNNLGILHVGAFDAYKDQKNLFLALQIVDSLFDDKIEDNINFTWIGYNGWGSDCLNEVNDFLSQFSFKKIKITVLPFTKDLKNLKEEYLKNGLYVVSSISEGLSVAMLEALSCGLFVVSTRCGGSEDVINEDNGVLVDIRDSHALASSILKYLNNGYNFNRKTISQNIIKQFNELEFSKNLYKLYVEALK